jgi:hypothetical protein
MNSKQFGKLCALVVALLAIAYGAKCCMEWDDQITNFESRVATAEIGKVGNHEMHEMHETRITNPEPRIPNPQSSVHSVHSVVAVSSLPPFPDSPSAIPVSSFPTADTDHPLTRPARRGRHTSPAPRPANPFAS